MTKTARSQEKAECTAGAAAAATARGTDGRGSSSRGASMTEPAKRSTARGTTCHGGTPPRVGSGVQKSAGSPSSGGGGSARIAAVPPIAKPTTATSRCSGQPATSAQPTAMQTTAAKRKAPQRTASDGNDNQPVARKPKAAVAVGGHLAGSGDCEGHSATRSSRSGDKVKATERASSTSRRQHGVGGGSGDGAVGTSKRPPSGGTGLGCLVAPLSTDSDRTEFRQPSHRARSSGSGGGHGGGDGCSGGSRSTSSAAAPSATAAAAAPVASSAAPAAVPAAVARTCKSKRKRSVDAMVAETTVVDLCTPPTTPPSTTDRNIRAQVKKVRSLKELTEDHLQWLIQKNRDHLKKIMKGETPCERHDQYGRGRKARHELDQRVPLLMFTEEQIDCIADALLHEFCGTSLERADYMLRVLLPEMLARIHMEVNCTTAAETERIFAAAMTSDSFTS